MRPVEQFLQIPLPDNHRKRTDICCTITSVVFPTLLLCWAIISFNKQHLLKANFPADSEGGVCGIDHPTKPYLFFPDPQNPLLRICVTKCPYRPIKRKCNPNSIECMKSLQKISLQQQRIGKICTYSDQRVKDIIEYDADRNTRRTFFNVWDSIILATTLSIVSGTIYLVMVQLFPYQMNWISVAFGGIASAVLGVLIYTRSIHLKHAYHLALNGLALFFVIAGITTLISGWARRLQMKVNSVFLIYASIMLKQSWPVLFYIPLFLAAVSGLVALTLFELFSFWSRLPPVFNPQSLYWLLQSDRMLTLSTTLVGIQLIWGLNFIAQAFNFLIAGNGVQFYFGVPSCLKPLTRLILYHWGSVAGGSFLIGFFGFFDAFFDFFKPTAQNTWHASCCSNYFSVLYDFFDIVRHDTMGYINLTGLPYCNSARYCDFLSVNTPLFGGNQSISRLFRFSGHLLLTSIVTIIGIYYAGFTTLYSVAFTILITYFTVEMFASLHANAAEGICVSFLAEQYLQHGNFLNVKRAPPGLVQQLQQVLTL